MCVYELKYLTIQLLYCEEAVLSAINLGINSGLSKQLLLYLHFLTNVCCTCWQCSSPWIQWGSQSGLSVRGWREATRVATVTALAHAEPAAS